MAISGQGKRALPTMPNYQKVRLFYPTELGLEWAQYVDFPVTAHLIAACDLDGDGFDELIVRQKTAPKQRFIGAARTGSASNAAPFSRRSSEILQPEEEKALQSDMEKKFEAPVCCNQ